MAGFEVIIYGRFWVITEGWRRIVLATADYLLSDLLNIIIDTRNDVRRMVPFSVG